MMRNRSWMMRNIWNIMIDWWMNIFYIRRWVMLNWRWLMDWSTIW